MAVEVKINNKRVLNFSKAVRVIDFSSLENWQSINPEVKSGLYIEWCDCCPNREARFFIVEKDGPRNAWIASVPREHFSKLIPIAISAM